MLGKKWITVACCLGAAAVLLGAFGAHGLPDWLQRQGQDPQVVARRLDQFETAVRYQFYHALALLAAGILGSERHLRGWQWSAIAFAIGIVCFSGSLYGIVFTELRFLGMIAPVGGLLLTCGWLSLAWSVMTSPRAGADPR